MNTTNFINGKITIDPDICNGKPTISIVGWVAAFWQPNIYADFVGLAIASPTYPTILLHDKCTELERATI
jgi:hypothetical protein